jgi:hypothetical protein
MFNNHNKFFIELFGMSTKAQKYMSNTTTTTEVLYSSQRKPCPEAEHGGYGISGLPKWLKH